MKTSTKWLIGIAFFLVLVVAGLLIYQQFFKLKPAVSQTTASENFKAYKNDLYKFSFSYPKTWQEATDIPDKNTNFSVKFTDPVRLAEMETANCLISELNGWNLPKYNQNFCQEKIANLTQEQKDAKMQLRHEKDIIINVYKKDDNLTLKDWLEKYYRSFGGELANFNAQSEIIVDGAEGFAVQTGCCDDYYLKYVVLKNDNVYEIGTNYSDGDINDKQNSLLDLIVGSFNFN